MTNRECSNAQEHMVAKLLSWKVVSGSGARACHPGDVESGSWLGECKTHVKQHVPVCFKHDVWVKICDEAASRYKYPILFCDDGVRKPDHTWCIFSAHVLPDLVDGVNYPFPIQTNVTFSHKALINELSTCPDSLIKVMWNNNLMCLCTLSKFAVLADDMGWNQ